MNRQKIKNDNKETYPMTLLRNISTTIISMLMVVLVASCANDGVFAPAEELTSVQIAPPSPRPEQRMMIEAAVPESKNAKVSQKQISWKPSS